MFSPENRAKRDTRMLVQLASYLAHPHLDIPKKLCSIDFSERTLARIFLLLDSNRVLLRVLDSKNSGAFPTKSKVLSEFVNSSSMFENSYKYGLNLKEKLLDVIAKFNEHSIKSVSIKSLNTLPLDSDNFDILIPEKDLSQACKVLRDSGFIRINWYHEPYKWLFRKVRENESYLAVHIHTAIAWDGIRFVDVKDLWEKLREKEIDAVTVRFPSPEHHLLTTIAHAFFENRRFRLADLAYLIEDIQDHDIDWNYVVDWTIHDGWFDSFHGLLGLANHMYTAIFKDKLMPEKAYELAEKQGKEHGSNLAKKLVGQYNEKPRLPMNISTTAVSLELSKKIFTTPGISFFRKAEMIAHLSSSFIKRRIPIFRKHPVFLVGFIGQDGTGKTTHAKYAWNDLKQMSQRARGSINVKYLWSRGFGYSFQPFLLAVRQLLLGSKSPKTTQSNYVKRRATLLKREPMRSLWAYIMIIDHLLHLAKARLALSRGYIVICDRCITDTLIDVKCDLGKPLSKFLEGQIERLAPKPDMTFIMDTRTSELLKRRPMVDTDLLEYKRSAYLEYSHRKGFSIIATNEDLERNRKTVLAKIITCFFSRLK